MIVVSDTSPINYLVLIEAVDVLPRLFKQVLIPPAVREELTRQKTPLEVRAWISTPPSWLEVRAPQSVDESLGPHRGETEAIALVEELKADRLLIDERDATNVARRRGIRVVGTLAVLGEAPERRFIHLPTVIESLSKTNFRGPRALIEKLLFEDASRRSQEPDRQA